MCIRVIRVSNERWRLSLKIRFGFIALVLVVFTALDSGAPSADAQSAYSYSLSSSNRQPSASLIPDSFASSASGITNADITNDNSTDAEGVALPAAPEPAGGGYDHYSVTPAASWYQPPFSRIGIGADVSLLGIGIKSAIVLNHDFDARALINFFNFDTGLFEVDGFHVDAKVHMASAAAALDWYPYNSVFRLSGGVFFFNNNQISGSTHIAPGTSFTLQQHTYYSASPNPVTGATPLTGSGVLSFHQRRPAAMVSGGFGKFIPRSDRHWSFPSEFGVIFTGPPTINVNVAGWACLDAEQTQCSNIGSPTNPIAIQFNNDLHGRLARWQNDLNKVGIYPIFSYSVVYSFNIK